MFEFTKTPQLICDWIINLEKMFAIIPFSTTKTENFIKSVILKIIMEQKQVIVIALLVMAIILSTASVMMSVSVMNSIQIREAPAVPRSSGVALEVLPSPDQNIGGIDSP